MPYFKKKPIIVTAEPFLQDAYDATGYLPQGACNCRGPWAGPHTHTLEGVYTLKHGQWVILGIHHEPYPCDDEIFRETYDPVEKDAPHGP